MQISEDDLALVRNALFAYGLANADTAQGMRAQELYRLLKDDEVFRVAREEQQQPRKVSRRQRARTPRARVHHVGPRRDP
jgi:hypothetical protein